MENLERTNLTKADTWQTVSVNKKSVRDWVCLKVQGKDQKKNKKGKAPALMKHRNHTKGDVSQLKRAKVICLREELNIEPFIIQQFN